MTRFEVLNADEESVGIFSKLTQARRAARKLPGYEIWRGYETSGIYGESPEFVAEIRVEHREDLTGCDDDRVLQGLGRPNYSEVEFPPELPCREF